MFKTMTFVALFAVAISCSGNVHGAYVVGTAGVVDLGTTMASPSNNLSTATSFSLSGITLSDPKGFTGDFMVGPTKGEALGDATLTLANSSTSTPFSFSFGSGSTFGTFVGTSIYSDAIGPNSRAFDIIGLFSAGTDFTNQAGKNFVSTQEMASFTVSFTQSTGGTISASATLSTPPVTNLGTVPEPTSIAMVVLGLGLVGAARRIRRAGK